MTSLTSCEKSGLLLKMEFLNRDRKLLLNCLYDNPSLSNVVPNLVLSDSSRVHSLSILARPFGVCRLSWVTLLDGHIGDVGS